ncbi:MAG TPA: SurA N-terminal domain-containing protein [Acidiferrobacter sp.]|nr:SurA N-terminal domain-containing protein [Acidiferrobacter sp.]
MLNALRDKIQGLMGMALLVILVVPFALWGVSSYFGGASTVYVARGHGLRITESAFQGSLAQQRAALEKAYGKNLNVAELSSQKFKKAVLDGLINRTLLLRDADRAGYVTNPIELAEEIRQIPAFRVNGHFDPARYQALLADQGLTVPGFEHRVRNLMLLNQVKVGLYASAFVPTPEIVRAVELFGQQRSIAYVVLSPRPLARKIPVTTAEITQYYATHSENFRLPQKIRVAYLLLSPDTVIHHLHTKVGMAALQQAYQSNIPQFTQPAMRRVRHIMIALPAHPTATDVAQAKAKLVAIRARIVHGTPFSVLAKRYSADQSSAAHGGSLGYVTESELSKPIGKAAFALALNHVSAPIVGNSGVHLLEVTAIRAGKVQPFAAVKGKLTQMVLRERARHLIYRLSEELRNAAFEHPHSLKPAAQKIGLPLQESDWFGQTGGGTGIAALPQVVKAVFAPKVLAGRRNTHAITLGEDAMLIAHVIARQPARTEPLSVARPKIIQAIRQTLAEDRVKHEQGVLLAQLKTGASLRVIARQMGLVLKAPPPFEMVAPKLPHALVEAVFRTRFMKGHPVPGTASLSRGRQAVFVVRRVVMGKVDPSSARYLKLKQSFTNDVGVEVYLAYIKSLRERADIHTHMGSL